MEDGGLNILSEWAGHSWRSRPDQEVAARRFVKKKTTHSPSCSFKSHNTELRSVFLGHSIAIVRCWFIFNGDFRNLTGLLYLIRVLTFYRFRERLLH